MRTGILDPRNWSQAAAVSPARPGVEPQQGDANHLQEPGAGISLNESFYGLGNSMRLPSSQFESGSNASTEYQDHVYIERPGISSMQPQNKEDCFPSSHTAVEAGTEKSLEDAAQCLMTLKDKDRIV
jgi:hypothetical protein